MIKDDLCRFTLMFTGNRGEHESTIVMELPRFMYDELVHDVNSLCERASRFDAILESEKETRDEQIS